MKLLLSLASRELSSDDDDDHDVELFCGRLLASRQSNERANDDKSRILTRMPKLSHVDHRHHHCRDHEH